MNEGGLLLIIFVDSISDALGWRKRVSRITSVYFMHTKWYGYDGEELLRIGCSHAPKSLAYSTRQGPFLSADVVAEIYLDSEEDARSLLRHIKKRLSKYAASGYGSSYFYLKEEVIAFCREIGIDDERITKGVIE